MKIIASVFISALLLLSSGCATMKFTQDLPPGKELKAEKVNHWHHTMLNGIVEISEPANLYKDCQGKLWKEATVNFKGKNVLVAAGANAVLAALLFSWDFLAFYSPWNVEIQCTK